MNRNFYWTGFSVSLVLFSFVWFAAAGIARPGHADLPMRFMGMALAFALAATVIKLKTQAGARRELLAAELGLERTPPELPEEKNKNPQPTLTKSFDRADEMV